MGSMSASASTFRQARAGRLSPRCLRVLPGALLSVMLALPLRAAAPPAADERLDLDALRGHVVYLDFWASWCAPCRESFPWMNRLQREYAHDGLVVVAVNVDRHRGDADAFLREHTARFRIVFDPEGTLPEKFGVRGMPTSFLIDRAGRIRSRHEGFRLRERDALAQQVRSLVLAN